LVGCVDRNLPVPLRWCLRSLDHLLADFAFDPPNLLPLCFLIPKLELSQCRRVYRP